MSDTEIADLKRRVDKLESQLSFLLRRLNIGAEELPGREASAEVLELVRRGDVRGAIRAFMDETSCSLSDAKRFVESLKV